MAFNRPANNKQLSFNEVSLKTKLPEDEIELLVMRALSLRLVKGSIDQIDKNIFISWVQPRVLDINQVRIYGIFKGIRNIHAILFSFCYDLKTRFQLRKCFSRINRDQFNRFTLRE